MENEKIVNSLDNIIDGYRNIKKLHEKIEEKKGELNSPDSIKRYTTSSRQEELDNFVSDCNAKEKSIRKEMSAEVKNIQNEVCGVYQYNPDITHDIDFLTTMARGGMISGNMISTIASKYKGSESSLLFLKQKLKDAGLSASPVDEMLFSGSEIDLNGNSHFIPPTKYFDALSSDIESGLNDASLLYNLGMISRKTGAESTSLQNLKTEIAENLDKSMNNMPPVFQSKYKKETTKITSNLHFKCEIVYLYALAPKIANLRKFKSKLLYESYPQVIHKVIHNMKGEYI